MDKTIHYIGADFINHNTDFSALIEALKTGFKDKTILVPLRHHHDFPNPEAGKDTTLLLMPAWNPSYEAGVKIATVSPNNGLYDLPAIQGIYIYLDAHVGTVQAIIEAKSLTAKRTAATSALASSFLSNAHSSSLLMIGTGALAANLILAHVAVRPIKQVYVWGRDFEKAQLVCEELNNEAFDIQPVTQLENIIGEVDIVSCATLSPIPLVLGNYLRDGQHIDLVGSYKKDMREADNAAIAKSRVFIDTPAALKETGDIILPIQEGVLTESAIQADLFELCNLSKKGRKSVSEITLFKSVGHALEDLVAAKYYFKKYNSSMINK
jgi:ornithine cyclodeaminase/alanine dehydrogenase-like protein (mu-crystallin family)